MILAIDTSTESASVAAAGATGPLAEITWRAQRRHSIHLMDAIRQAMKLADACPSDFTSIAAAVGPGSFNGLRVGLSAAKGMAMALHVPLVGISTLDIIALQASRSNGVVWATVPAGRGEVCLAPYTGENDDWRRIGDYARMPLVEAAARCREQDAVAGPGADTLTESARQAGIRLVALRGAAGLTRAAYLAELGNRYFDSGGPDQIDEVEPLYLRRSAAEENRAAAEQE